MPVLSGTYVDDINIWFSPTDYKGLAVTLKLLNEQETKEATEALFLSINEDHTTRSLLRHAVSPFGGWVIAYSEFAQRLRSKYHSFV